MSQLFRKSLTQVRDLLKTKEVKASEVLDDCLERITATEPKVNALLNVRAEEAKDEAAALDAVGPAGDKPLWGVPVIIKDVICSKGTPTTAASKILENFSPFYDAFVVEQLKNAGAIILGKANMDEFAMGSSTENSAYGPTKNPWDLVKVPGGSSGGSAASMAARQSFATLGTDTGGSIRQPASLCGIVGLKPTYGRVSRRGCIAFGSSLDQIGPMTMTARDAAAVLSVIAGHDAKDSTSVNVPVPDYEKALDDCKDLQGLKVGLPEEYWSGGLDPEVEACCKAAVAKLEELGATTVPVSLPHTKYAVSVYYIVALAEAGSNLARYDGVRYGVRSGKAEELSDLYVESRSAGFGDEVKRRILLGTYVLSAGYYDAYYKKGAQVRRLIRNDFLSALESCDVICGPVSPSTAWGLGEKTDDPLQMYLSDIFTLSLNLAGLPGLSVPVGLGADSKLPVGLQLIGPSFGEERLLAVAEQLQQNMDPLPEPHGIA
jgi:aspartyl-tRNA(Asn)/glutamyl-tRNA(Gln) amidotransferase subunit A